MSNHKQLLVDIGHGLSLMVGLPAIESWKSSERPKTSKRGRFGFNSETKSLEYWDGTAWFSAPMTEDWSFTYCILFFWVVICLQMQVLNFIKNIGPTEMVIIALILILFFGSKVVTRLARTSGETLKEIKQVKKTFTDAVSDTVNGDSSEKKASD